MIPFACAAAGFIDARGPVRMPLRACCAAAIVRTSSAPASDLDSTPFVCAADRFFLPQPATIAERGP